MSFPRRVRPTRLRPPVRRRAKDRSPLAPLLISVVALFTVWLGRPGVAAATPPDTVWFDDGLPPGAAPSSLAPGVVDDGWIWSRGDPATVTHWLPGTPALQASDPVPFSGSLGHRSPFSSGQHGHGFANASHPLEIAAGDVMVNYVYNGPQQATQEIVIGYLHSNDAGGTSTAWARWSPGPTIHPLANIVSLQNSFYAGRLPRQGRWDRLEAAAGPMGLEGKNVHGMVIYVQGGSLKWDRSGKIGTQVIADGPPAAGAIHVTGPSAWSNVSTSPIPFAGSQSVLNDSADPATPSTIEYLPLTHQVPVATGESMVVYVHMKDQQAPREIMVSFLDETTSWEHRAYWGEDAIAQGKDDTASRWFVSPLPPANAWVRLEVPASLLDLEGHTISGVRFSVIGGIAAFNRFGTGPGPHVDEELGPFTSYRDVTNPADWTTPALTAADLDPVLGVDVADKLQALADQLGQQEVMYFPAGVYRLGHTVQFGASYKRCTPDPAAAWCIYGSRLPLIGVSLLGEDMRKTIFRWVGGAPSDSAHPTMLFALQQFHTSRLSQMTFQGNDPDAAVPGPMASTGIWMGEKPGFNSIVSDTTFQDLDFGIRTGNLYDLYDFDGTPLCRLENTAECAPTCHPGPDGPVCFNNNDNHAEGLVTRCAFLRMRKGGFSPEGYNSKDWELSGNYFSHNQVSIAGFTLTNAGTVVAGYGQASATSNVFRASIESDIIAGLGIEELRGNLSYRSTMFFGSLNRNLAGPTVLIGNTVLDPLVNRYDYGGYATGVAVQIQGHLTFLDNFFSGTPEPGLDTLVRGTVWTAMGNSYSTPSGIEIIPGQEAYQKTEAVDEHVGVTVVPWPVTTYGGPLRRYPRPLHEVGPPVTAQAISSEISAACAEAQRSVVHIPGGSHFLDAPLTIPASCDVQLTGDGRFATRLIDAGAIAQGPLLTVQGDRAAVRDLALFGADVGISNNGPPQQAALQGIAVQMADVPDNRVIGEHVEAWYTTATGISIHGFADASAELVRPGMDGNYQGTALVVEGNPALPNRSSYVFTSDLAVSQVNGYAVDVRHGGHLILADALEENHSGISAFTVSPSPAETYTFARLTSSGRLTADAFDLTLPSDSCEGANPKECPAGVPRDPVQALEIDGFSGTVSFLECMVQDGFGGLDNPTSFDVKVTSGAPASEGFYQFQHVVQLALPVAQILNPSPLPATHAVVQSDQFVGNLTSMALPTNPPGLTSQSDPGRFRRAYEQLRVERPRQASPFWTSGGHTVPSGHATPMLVRVRTSWVETGVDIHP